MQYCKHCNAYYYKKSTTCTICGRPLIEGTHESRIITQGYPAVVVHKNRGKFAAKIFGILTIATIIIVGLINGTTYEAYPSFWSLIVIGPLVYVWILLAQIIVSKQNYPTKVNRQVILISLVVILIDLMTDYKAWSLTYVVPSLLVTTTFVLPIVIASTPKTYYLHVRSLFFLILLNILVGVVGLTTNFMEPNVIWTSLSVLTAGILLLATMFIFARKDTWTELIKIFRI